jgi:abequosyltransferase
MEIGLDEAFVGTLWSLSVRILQMIPTGLTVKYLGAPLLDKRGENDSFMDRGLVHRYSIAIDGYHRIADELFGVESFEACHIRRVIVNEYPPQAFFLAKRKLLRNGRLQELAELDRLAEKTYAGAGPRNAVYRALYRYFPLRLYEYVRPLYKSLRALLRPAPRA